MKEPRVAPQVVTGSGSADAKCPSFLFELDGVTSCPVVLLVCYFCGVKVLLFNTEACACVCACVFSFIGTLAGDEREAAEQVCCCQEGYCDTTRQSAAMTKQHLHCVCVCVYLAAAADVSSILRDQDHGGDSWSSSSCCIQRHQILGVCVS